MFFTPPQEPPKAPIVTVWIHGTQPDANLPHFLKKIVKETADTLGGRSRAGLHRTAELDAQHYPFLQAKALSAANPDLFQFEHHYAFGWSGKLSLRERKIATHDLFYSLKALSSIYQQKYGLEPEFVLIAHSHGGNIILHLAEIQDPDGFKLHVTKAILLACPVQKHTSHLIANPMFERVYSLHSHTDIVQIMDPQGLHKTKKAHTPLLSARHFDLNPKLVQAAIRWKDTPSWQKEDYCYNLTMERLIKTVNSINYLKRNRGLLHLEFRLLPFLRQVPAIINQLDNLFENNANCPSHKDHDLIIEL